MDTPSTWLDHLKLLAAAEKVSLAAIGPDDLADLLDRGLIEKDERPLQASLESRYEALQESHRQIVEAKGYADRLQRHLAPRSRLAGLLSLGTPAGPKAQDPEALALFHLLELLKIQVRGVRDPTEVLPHLDRIQDHLQVEGRDCLDRLAATDRELDQTQKQVLPGTQVEGLGFVRMTATGEATLPEAPVLQLLEVSLQTAFGPGPHGESFTHFKEDPSSLLTLLVDRLTEGERPSTVMNEYEALLAAFERLPLFAGIHPLRAKIGFLVRLLRASRDDPKRAYLWCSRERLTALRHRMDPLLPPSVAASGWWLPYTADIFAVDGGLFQDEEQIEPRLQLLQAVHRIQADLLQDLRIRDGQFFRLALVLAHAARVRSFAPGILMDRFIRQAIETILEAARCAPHDLGDRGTALIFGTHLAHAAGFTKTRLQGPSERFGALRERFLKDTAPTRLSIQVLLHIFATLERLQSLGTPLSLDDYEGLFERIRKRLRHHKAAARLFSSAQIKAGDEAALASNLCAQVCFRELPLAPKRQQPADVGLAGLYEVRQAGRPPLLGSSFGTLLLV